ncbi:hypothetical protein BD309DRAFT_1015280 [Dichomitus squalens]|uniref:Uncharacterized protein n=1 Tax=Dichomitus squalens TaxID=114155 RepID=A0A4Q9P9U4_9APHY|nr:hypothetical protein BD309DRAFT_1015280 [Dichomitus squalens]TBU57989.1 hypothetical protein BD310DRAFT_928066 [Dichomitus squalens]
MSPSTKPTRNLKVNVPRHNSQRIGPLLTASVEAVAREDSIRVDVSQTALEPSSALAQAIESASEWNSLLMTARADRGPQWDVGTQLFQVDEYSELYYDPTPLMGYIKEQQASSDESSSANPPSQRQQQEAINSPRIHRTASQGHLNPGLSPAQLYGSPQAMASPRHYPGANQGMPGGYGGMGGPIPPAQFYGTGGDGMPASPMQRGHSMGMGPGMGMAPGMGMSPGMGMMPPDGSMSPEVRRRVTRGMSMDEFGNMHG